MSWRPRGAVAVTLSLLAVLAMVAPAGAAIGGTDAVSDGATPVQDEPDSDVEPASTTADGESTSDGVDRSSAAGGGGGGPPVDPALENASGEIEVIVRFQEARETPGASANSVSALQNHAQQSQAGFREYARVTDAIEIRQSFWITNAMLVQINTSEVPPGQLLQLSGVERVHDNFELEAFDSNPANGQVQAGISTEPTTASHGGSAPQNATYGLHAVNATRAWEAFGTTGQGINVTVLDTGVNTSHPDIDIAAWAEVNSTGSVVDTDVSNATDSDGHGTHVSGTIAGGTLSDGSHYGVAPNATLKHGQVIPGGSGSFSQIIGGMEWAVNDTDSDVISMSLGATGYYPQLIDPVRNVRNQGIPLFVATGNVGEWRSGSPGNINESISVGAVGPNLQVAPFSNGEPIDVSEDWGSDAPSDWTNDYLVPEISAPGVDVVSVNGANGAYEAFDGTSMATPHVSGVAALMLAANGSLTDDQVEETIEATAHVPNSYSTPNHRYGYGVVDALNATASVTADTTVTGQVTNGTGAGIANATVRTEYGLQTQTNQTGWYELDVPSTEHNLTADPLGFEENTTAINGSGAGTLEQNFTVSSPSPEARLVAGESLYSNSTDGIELTYRMANVGNYSIEFDGGTYADASEASLSIGGTGVAFGENATVDVADPSTITVSINTTDGFYGSVGLNHTFYNRSGSGAYSDRTSPVMVHDDPVLIPQDVDPASLQHLIDNTYDNTTIALDDGTYTESPGSNDIALFADRPITVESQAGASPTIETQNSGIGDTSVYVWSPEVQIDGVGVDGGGGSVNVYVADSDLEIVDAEIHNAGYGVYIESGLTNRISNTTFHGLSEGIYSRSGSGDVRSIDNNTARNIGSAAINISTSVTPNTAITDNDFTINTGANVAILQLGNVSTISGNQITLNGSSADGLVTTGAPESAGTVTVTDNQVTGGGVGIEVGDPGVDVVRNNSVSNTSLRGISVGWTYRSSATVSENDIQNVGSHGIRSDPSINTVYHNNTIDGADRIGIRIWDLGPTFDSNVTISNNSIANVNRLGGYPAVSVFELGNAEIVDNDVSDGRISVENAANVTARRNTVTNAPVGFDVTRNSSNVRSENSTFTDVDIVFEASSFDGVAPTNVTFADANVTTENGTVRIADVPAGEVDVTDLSLADGTTVSASGHNASLALDPNPPGNYPANHGDIGAFLDLNDIGTNPSLDVNVSYGANDVADVRNETLALYRYNSSATEWNEVATTGVNETNQDVWASLDSFSTFAPLAEEQATFNVTSIEANASTVLEGETVQVNATINNTGDGTAEQDVTLDINGSVGQTVDSTNVTLDPGSETTVSLNWTTQDGQAGDYDATVTTEQDSNSTAVTVEAPANFSVNVTGTTSPVLEGETLDVDAEITNVGDRNDTQTINLTTDATQRDSTTIALNASESRNVTLSWPTGSDDAGDYTATVASENQSDSSTVTVQEPANFSVSIDSTNSPVTEGGNLTVDATINNTGDVSDTQEVNLTIDGGEGEVENTSVQLDPGTTTTETFNWTTAEGDAGDYNATVNSENDSVTTGVTVQTPANFSVNVTGSDSPVVQNETLSVNATINNTGESTDEQNITLRANGTEQNQTIVELDGGNGTDVTLQWDTTGVPPGNYTANVTSQDDNDTTEVEVLEQANFSVVQVSTNEPVLVNETVQVDATINNTGGVEATQNVTLDVEGVGVVDDVSEQIGPGNNSTVTLSWTNTTSAGDYNATVTTEDDSNTTSVRVDAPAYFAVENVNSSSPVVEGETLVVNATINNTGDRSDNQSIELAVGGTTNSTDVQLDAGNQTSVQFSWDTTTGDAGNYTANVSSANETVGTDVTVQEPANFSVTSIDSNDQVVANDTISVTATIENTGDVNDTQNVTLNVSDGPGVVDDQNVTLSGGETQTLTLNWSDTSPGDYNATVETMDDANTTNVRVDAPANFSVSIDSTNSNVTEGETLEVNATIANTGDVEDTQTINLTVDDAPKDSAELTLAGGENESVTLTWNTTYHDNGTYTANVSSDDTSDSTTVTVENASVYFQVTEFDAPDTATAGETFSVTATVTNYGVDNGTQNVTYWFDHAQVALEENVSIDAGNSTDVTFTHSAGTAGEYDHFVQTENDANNTNIEIQSSDGGGGGGGYLPPPSDDDGPSTSFVLSSLVVSPTEVGVGEQVSVEVRVDNDGEDDGEFTGTLTADGDAVAEETVSVNSNWHETFTLSTSFDEPGTYDLAVNGESAGTVTVVGGANLVITETNIESSSVRAGETVTLTTTVRNDGESEGSRTVSLEVGGETVDSRTVTLGPGESETVTFEHTFSATGSHEVTVGGERIPNVEVRESQADDGGSGGGSDGGVLLVLLGVLGVLLAAGSLAVYLYGDEISELLEG
jgi:subtilisin family serine protease